MKKFLAIAVIAVSFVACNDGEKKTEETKTSDTSVVVTPSTDATKTPDTSVVVKDTTVKVTTSTDTTKKH
jgi:hypothetical protein